MRLILMPRAVLIMVMVICWGSVAAQAGHQSQKNTSGNPARQSNFKVLSYNTLHGFNNNDVTKQTYINWVAKINPDVVVYQEMLEFSNAALKEFAARYGHAYAVIMSRENNVDVTHPLAITSKYPITDVKMVIDGMWHGYLYAKVNNVHVIATHLAPFTLADRQKDIATIIAQSRVLPENENIIVAGDFNAFARTDSAQYGIALVNSMKKLEGRLEPKSGTPIVKNRTIYRNNLNNGNLDFSVTDEMIKAGFIDAYYVYNRKFKNSVPVKKEMKSNSILRRIDYIWVNPALSKKLVKANIIHDVVTDSLSDHYPVLAEFIMEK